MAHDSTESRGGCRDRDEASNRSTRRTFLRATGAGAAGLVFGAAGGTVSAGVPTPRLHTEGRWLKDPLGNNVRLRGVSPASLDYLDQSWHPKGVEEVLRWATDESRGWYPNHLRLPVTQDRIDELGMDAVVEDLLRPAVDLCAARGVYAMIDFHLIRPYTQAATEDYNADEDDDLEPIDDVVRTFWEAVAPAFADDEHVLYELFNEPTYPITWGDYGEDVESQEAEWLLWRETAQPWVDLVREHAPETPLVIGSPEWTSRTAFAPEYPFEGENLLYASHIYPDNGQPEEFDDEYGAPAEEVPVFLTEFGWDPDSGDLDQGTTSEWGQPLRKWVESYENMHWNAWCFDDSWGPAMFDSPDEGANEPWELKDGPEQHGGFIKQWLEDRRTDSVPESPVDDETAPPAPQPTVARASEISLEIEWEAVTDEGEAGLSHYDVYLDGELESQGLTETAVTIGDLEPATAYEVGVSAVDEADNESDVATIEAETVAVDAEQSPYAEHAVPGRIQGEDFDEGGQGIAYYETTDENQAGAEYRETSVDIAEADAVDSGHYVGYVETGEWWEYTVDVPSDGSYDVAVHAASDADEGGTVRVEIDREEVASQHVWPTDGWESFEEMRAGSADIAAGEHVVRVYAEAGAWNFDWIEFDGDGEGDGRDGDGSDGDDGQTDALNAELVPTQTEAAVGERIAFRIEDVTGDDTWITALEWTFGDGTTATGWWNAHAYDEAGTYTVALSATDNEGTTTTDEVEITVTD